MSIVVCAICGENAEELYPVGDFEELKCPNCGHYSVNRQLIREMTAMKQSFHTSRTQMFLAVKSKSGVPIITRTDATFNELIVANSSNR